MESKKTKAVIFDLDGTLLDTLEDLCDSVNVSMDAIGAPHRTIDEVRNFVGNGIRRLMILCVPEGEKNPKFDIAITSFLTDYKVNCKNKTKPYYGIPQLLSGLADD